MSILFDMLYFGHTFSNLLEIRAFVFIPKFKFFENLFQPII